MYSERAIIVFVISIISFISTTEAQAVRGIPADSFVESICVNTHWAHGTRYITNYTALRVKLGESGIRYIRDETFLETYPAVMDLYHSFGIKINMLFGRGPSGPRPPLNLSNIGEEINQMKAQVLPAVVTIEGPNEYDDEHGPDTEWVARIRNYTQILYTLAKADETVKNLPIIGPSLTSQASCEAVGDLDQYIDHPNLHIYQWYWPGFSNVNDTGHAGLTWYFNFEARYQSPSHKPIYATESGYTNYIPQGGISEEAEGKYMARLYAELFRRGVVRTCQYELVDEDKQGREGLFGLLRLNITEKPAFRAVKTLITILSDKGPDFQPASLNYAFDGNVSNIRHILFHKRNGVFYIMVWLELSSWDVQAKIDLYPPPQEVVLTIFANYNAVNATIYAFDNNADLSTSVAPIDNFQVRLNVTDKITIIELSNITQI
jgi:hypothetical protein